MLNYLKNRTLLIFKDEKGQGMVEYALIIGFVAVVVIAVLILLGPAIAAKFQEIIDAL
ncbi:MAG: Flp family type IVb pilin [Clostridiaceae bacterium]